MGQVGLLFWKLPPYFSGLNTNRDACHCTKTPSDWMFPDGVFWFIKLWWPLGKILNEFWVMISEPSQVFLIVFLLAGIELPIPSRWSIVLWNIESVCQDHHFSGEGNERPFSAVLWGTACVRQDGWTATAAVHSAEWCLWMRGYHQTIGLPWWFSW